MAMETLSGGNIEPRGLEEEMRSSYLDYAMSVIVGRALPQPPSRPRRPHGSATCPIPRPFPSRHSDDPSQE